MTLALAMLLLRLVNKRRPLTGNTPALTFFSLLTQPDSTGSVGSERIEVGQWLGAYYEDLSSKLWWQFGTLSGKLYLEYKSYIYIICPPVSPFYHLYLKSNKVGLISHWVPFAFMPFVRSFGLNCCAEISSYSMLLIILFQDPCLLTGGKFTWQPTGLILYKDKDSVYLSCCVASLYDSLPWSACLFDPFIV